MNLSINLMFCKVFFTKGGNILKSKFNRRMIVILLAVLLPFSILVGCSTSIGGDTSPIGSDEINSLFQNPDDFKGRTFEFTGKVYDVNSDSGTTYYVVWYDITNSDKAVVVGYTGDQDPGVNRDDYVKINGTVKGKYSGESYVTSSDSAPEIESDSIEKISAVEAFPAEKSVDVNQTNSQNGINATISKVEFTSDGELRIYLKVENTTGGSIHAYPNQGVVVQDGNQISPDTTKTYLYNTNLTYGDIQSGASIDIILAFANTSQSNFSYSFTCYDSNFQKADFNFDVTVQ